MSDEIGIEAHDLHFSYGAKEALTGATFVVPAGCFVALLGPNGAGKSTLVALLTGLIVSQRGYIKILGEDVARNPLGVLAQLGVVFQSQTLDLDLSVRQNMRYCAALRGLPARTADPRIDEALDRMGLGGRGHEKARALNGGHRRRLEIARALVHSPRVLILDEPTSGLDVASRNELVVHVHRLCADRALTVLWATHLVDEVWEHDYLVVLHRGRAAAAGFLADVLVGTSSNTVLDAFNRLTGAEDRLRDDPDSLK